jgi:hypothetical protein
METLHSVLRAIRGEPKPRRDHLSVFKEFLAHLDRAAQRPATKRSVKAAKTSRRPKR